MNVSKLNPIGYDAKTEKGNTYKRSNLATSAFVLGTAALDTAICTGKKVPPIIKWFSFADIFGDYVKPLKNNINPKWKLPINALGIAVDLFFAKWVGRGLDNYINKKRIEKADSTNA
ncbi:MAG: hypothetical protein E7Z87_06940 [Cyanobacteria bacterium SIG26]|nr:hypothetical protein [Cyanobacteria bacterium SIG26]